MSHFQNSFLMEEMASSVIVAVQSVTNGANDEKLACKVTYLSECVASEQVVPRI